ncbi:MAG: SLC13 family permease [Eubacteriales bacterium]|uniref:SLC13 family permease n=1 Tax=Fenollaria sp. TaxID=1965292 RepID=UPI002A756046|nr:SLC13 family permease [Fenollaria sp.]MDD7339661.1 SLC13 family permease [Eubacteriales bacterium]MDY3106447.1 SLC13 family permease [Fenollaria sp.]
MDRLILAAALFVITYIFMIKFVNHRPLVVGISALVFIILNIVPLNTVWGAIDFNVLLMIGGTMMLVSLFSESLMPTRLADLIINKVKDIRLIILFLSMFAGFVSAFIDNVATVLMIAPVAMSLAKKLNISPVKMIIAISISSNLQGAATLVGDTSSILLGSALNMTFFDFFVYNGHMGMFWIVQISALIASIVIYIQTKDMRGKVDAIEVTKVKDMMPTYLVILMIVLLIFASFIPQDQKIDILNGLICVCVAIFGVIYHLIRHKDSSIIKTVASEIDFNTLGLLAGLFIIISGIENAGVIDEIAKLFIKLADKPFLLYTALVWGSVLISAFVDNIPYVATMLPVLSVISTHVPFDMTVFYFGLLSGATLGGNITPIGASANIASLGILKEAGYTVENKDFMKMSVPFTLTAVLVGYILVWFIYR